MTAQILSPFTERQNRSLKRIVEMIRAAQSRTLTCYKHVRQHDRKEFQDQVLVCLPSPAAPEPSEDHPTTFPGLAYDLSQGGVGLLALVPIGQTNVSIGIKRPDGSFRWLRGTVVRARPIPNEEFIDYGISFQRQPRQP